MARIESKIEKLTRAGFQWAENRMRDAPFTIPHYAKQLRDSLKNTINFSGSVVRDVILEPVNTVVDLVRYGHNRSATALGGVLLALPANIAFESFSKGESTETILAKTACIWALESLFLAGPIHDQLRRQIATSWDK